MVLRSLFLAALCVVPVAGRATAEDLHVTYRGLQSGSKLGPVKIAGAFAGHH